MLIYTYTHDTDCLTLLLRDIQLINTEYTPCKYRTDAEPAQDLHSGYTAVTQDLLRVVTALRP